MNRTNGKIAQQSKQKMVQALLALMKQYPYREITVTQITQEARLSRKTFYRLFSDKDDILSLFFDGLFQECFEQIKARRALHYWDVVQVFFDFWEDRRALLSLFQQHGLLPRVFERSYQYSMPVFEWVRSKETAASFAHSLPYMLAYSVGGMHSMLLQWASQGMTVPSKKLIAQLKAGFSSENL